MIHALLKHSENKRTNFLKKSIDLFFQYKSIDLFPRLGFKFFEKSIRAFKMEFEFSIQTSFALIPAFKSKIFLKRL